MNVILWEYVISWVFITYFTLTAAKTSLYRVNPQPQFTSLLSSILPHKFMPLPKPQYYSGSWYRLLNCCKTFWQGWVGECSVTVMIFCAFYCGSIKKQTNKQTNRRMKTRKYLWRIFFLNNFPEQNPSTHW